MEITVEKDFNLEEYLKDNNAFLLTNRNKTIKKFLPVLAIGMIIIMLQLISVHFFFYIVFSLGISLVLLFGLLTALTMSRYNSSKEYIRINGKKLESEKVTLVITDEYFRQGTGQLDYKFPWNDFTHYILYDDFIYILCRIKNVNQTGVLVTKKNLGSENYYRLVDFLGQRLMKTKDL